MLHCSGRLRAYTGSVKFALRALEAQEMPRKRKIRCCRAAGKPAIHADRRRDQRSNSQTAGLNYRLPSYRQGQLFCRRTVSR
jgi:hypothetical protein